MKKELEIWQFVAERLARNQSAMLLAVAESAGSSPGRQGFKMAVGENGEMRGSVGGGVMEVRLVEKAISKIRDSKLKISSEQREIQNLKSKIVEQVHRKNSPDKSGMICSGKQTVIFYRLDFRNLPVVRRIVRALENDESKILRITSGAFEILENETDDFDFRFEKTGGDFTFQEKLGFKHKLSIVGGGHCAFALSELMSKMDFHVELFDDRADLNTFAENNFAHRKQIIASYENIGDFIDLKARSHFVVVMTLGYKTDEIVVRKLLSKDFKYFGVLGSRAKMKTLFRNLEKEGVEPEKLNNIRAPVGVPINSRTPEEIAVSIAAEIIAVKNG